MVSNSLVEGMSRSQLELETRTHNSRGHQRLRRWTFEEGSLECEAMNPFNKHTSFQIIIENKASKK